MWLMETMKAKQKVGLIPYEIGQIGSKMLSS